VRATGKGPISGFQSISDLLKRADHNEQVELVMLVDRFVDLGEQFLAAAEDADPKQLESLAARAAPVNYRDPRNGATALHYVASQGARPAFRALLKIGRCDFLVRDNQERLASELAGTYGQDLAMERLLLKKEIRQARETGVPIDYIYRRDRETIVAMISEPIVVPKNTPEMPDTRDSVRRNTRPAATS
jgi:ankyrin repeat protein